MLNKLEVWKKVLSLLITYFRIPVETFMSIFHSLFLFSLYLICFSWVMLCNNMLMKKTWPELIIHRRRLCAD